MSVNKPIRGIASLSILIGHTWRMPNCSLVTKWLFSLVVNSGFLWVAYFFFMSGYGLMNNYMKRVDYSNGFLRKRLGELLIPCFMINTPYVAFRLLTGQYPSFMKMALAFFVPSQSVSTWWYVTAIAFFYFCFYCAMKIAKAPKSLLILITSVSVLAVIFAATVVQAGAHWWISTLAFPWGVMHLCSKEKLYEKYSSKWFRYTFLSAFIVLYCVSQYLFVILGDTIVVHMLRLVCSLLFVISISAMQAVTKTTNRMFSWLGAISYEIYLIHPIIIWLTTVVVPTLNNCMQIMLVAVLSIITAFIVKHFCDVLVKKLLK